MTTRRRRLLNDETTVDDDAASEDGVSRHEKRADKDAAGSVYARQVRAGRRCGVHELVPLRYSMIALALGIAVTTVGIVMALHVAVSGSDGPPAEALASLSLDGPRNVSQWLASSLACCAVLVSVFIYSLRRHRVDDYYGRYRVWLWTATAALGVSLFETTDAAQLAGEGLANSAAILGLDQQIVILVLSATVAALFGVRILFEVRRCRLAVLCCILATGCGLAAAGTRLQWWELDGAALIVARSAELTAYALGVATFLLYARHVVFEIQGLVKVAPAKIKRRKKSAASSEGVGGETSDGGKRASVRLRTDLDSGSAASGSSPARSSSSASKSATTHETTSLNIDETPHRGVSRSERRRMRRDSRMAS